MTRIAVAAGRMTIAAFVLAALSAPLRLARADEPCTDQANEALIRACLGHAVALSEKRLEKKLSEVMAADKAEEEQFKLKFHASQEAWKIYRRAECDLEGDAYRGGALEADQAALCQISKNNGRIRELEDDMKAAQH